MPIKTNLQIILLISISPFPIDFPLNCEHSFTKYGPFHKPQQLSPRLSMPKGSSGTSKCFSLLQQKAIVQEVQIALHSLARANLSHLCTSWLLKGRNHILVCFIVSIQLQFKQTRGMAVRYLAILSVLNLETKRVN